MSAWWRGIGGSVCAVYVLEFHDTKWEVSLGKGKEQMESHIIISEPYQGLDESWVGVKSVLDGQARNHMGKGEGMALKDKGLVHFMIQINLGPRFVWTSDSS